MISLGRNCTCYHLNFSVVISTHLIHTPKESQKLYLFQRVCQVCNGREHVCVQSSKKLNIFFLITKWMLISSWEIICKIVLYLISQNVKKEYYYITLPKSCHYFSVYNVIFDYLINWPLQKIVFLWIKDKLSFKFKRKALRKLT